ncbi:MAG: trypsin-like serine protease [Curvibacter sp.]|nr:MAG: trypsin-like serine protease [Curvibacter sp.]
MKANLVRWGLTLGLAGLLAACGGGTGTGSSTVAERQLPASALGTPVDSFTPTEVKSAAANSEYTLGAKDPAPGYKISLGNASTDVAKLQSAVDIRSIGQAPQIGLGRKIAELDSATTFASRLQCTTDNDGVQRAAIRFTSSGAAGTRLALDVSHIDARTKLRFYAQGASTATEITGTQVIDALAANELSKPGATGNRLYFAPYVEGEDLTMQIELPAGVATSTLQINVPQLSHLFQSPTAAKLTLKINNSGSCEVDVACNSDWSSTGNSVARLLFSDASTGSSYLCTGTLLNDRASSATPYLLTANHCISSQTVASTLQTFWFYRASACGSGTLYSGSKTVTGGAALLYTDNSSDATFLRLNSTPPAGVTYSGWSPSLPAVGTSIAGVHHPAGDLQKVSVGSTTGYATCSRAAGSETFSCSYTSSSGSTTTHVRVGWSSGVTEGGSSGSGLFITSGSSKYLVGQLSGGGSTCSNPTANDVYGRFDVPYTAAIYQWLDNSSSTTSRTPVFRFYNTKTQAHFYTASTSERDYVIATYPQFSYEGTSFYAYMNSATGLSPVFRFYNSTTGTHFYTISTSERAYVNQSLPAYRDEGTFWYAKTASDGSNSALYRFYNSTTGAHFYTMSSAERDYVISSLPKFAYEGIAYYSWTTQ